MKQRFFITSTGTGIGKSFITAALARQAKALKHTVAAYKPVISGFDPAKIEESDTGLLLRALDLAASHKNIEKISPWRFVVPLAPSMAARLEKKPIDFEALIAHGKKAMAGPEDIILIEGIGGVMVPMDDKHAVADWISALGIKAILVTGNYLGAISHTLTALESLQKRQIPLHAVIVNESENSSVSLQGTADELSGWIDVPLIAIGRRASDGWQDVKALRALLA